MPCTHDVLATGNFHPFPLNFSSHIPLPSPPLPSPLSLFLVYLSPHIYPSYDPMVYPYSEAMSLLTLDARVIMNIGAGDPLLSDLDQAVKQLKYRMNNKILTAMRGPSKLCKMYNEFSWLLDEDLEDYLDNFVITCDNGSPSRADFQVSTVSQSVFQLLSLFLFFVPWTAVSLSLRAFVVVGILFPVSSH